MKFQPQNNMHSGPNFILYVIAPVLNHWVFIAQSDKKPFEEFRNVWLYGHVLPPVLQIALYQFNLTLFM